MNTDTNNASATQRISDDDTQARTYRPRLSFYHANGKGTGSAVRFEVVPASGDRDGAVFLTLALQKSVASGSASQGNRQYATFDWQNRLTVKLNFSDLCQMLLVFNGQAAAIADGKGLYHDSRNTTTIINLSRQAEPHPGLALDVSRKGKSESDPAVRARIVFNGAEAFGLGAALEQVLGLLAFGVPKEVVSSPFLAQGDAERAAM